MEIKRFNLINIIIPLFILNVAFCSKVFSQATGSLFMLQDNFHSQMLNPSYMRNDNAIEISIVGFAGATVGNSGSFKISDLVVKNQSRNLAMDFEHFYNTGNLESSILDWSSIPLIFVGIPLSEGRLSIYLKEQVQSSLNAKMNLQEFVNIGNYPDKLRSYNTDNINYSGMSYHELAVGYARNINEKISIGIRGKVLFGAAFTDVKNWEYGVNTTESGDKLELTHKGTGRISLPVSIYLYPENRVSYVNSENIAGNYLTSFHNPGLGIDFGATINLNERSWLSVSATDLGAIWFRYNTMNIEHDASYVIKDSETSNYIESNISGSYFDPYNLILKTKDEIPYLYQPFIDTTSFVQGLVPKTSLHYQYNFSDKFSVGVTNQSAFYKKNILNILSISALQKRGEFSFFENINLYRLNNVTIGAGFQYEGKFALLFASTDNLLAVYNPAKNESFSFTLGISLLLNKTPKNKSPDGNFSPYFPFYENRK